MDGHRSLPLRSLESTGFAAATGAGKCLRLCRLRAQSAFDSPGGVRYHRRVEKLQYILIAFVPLLFSLSFHEAAHAWMADRLGDPTARYMGRMTLNPLPHIDPIGTLLLPLLFYWFGGAIFGWAKPVPVNERNLRRPHRDGLFVAAAGPGSNLVLALGFALLLYVFRRSTGASLHAGMAGFVSVWEPIQLMLVFGVQINALLAVFNLLPLPPLDGSHVLVGFFPSLAPRMAVLQRFGLLVLILLLYTNVLDFLVFFPSRVIYSHLLAWAM